MAADAAEFEWCKFRHCLDELKTEIPGFPLTSEFRDIESQTEKYHRHFIEKGSPIEYLDLLRWINGELAESRIFMHHFNEIENKNILRFNSLTMKLFLRKRRKKLSEIKGKLEQMSSNPSTSLTHHSAVISEGDEIIGFDMMAEEIEDVLLRDNERDDNQNFIAYGITGIAGTGKTTLARQVFNSPRICNTFLMRIWVSLSEDEELNKSQINKCKSKQKCLVVLDGVCQEQTWYESLSSLDGAVIITSRKEHIVKQMLGECSSDFITHLDPDTTFMQKICYQIFDHYMKKDHRFIKIGGRDIVDVLLEGQGHGLIAYTMMNGARNSDIAHQILNHEIISREFPMRIRAQAGVMELGTNHYNEDMGKKIIEYMKEEINKGYKFNGYNVGGKLNNVLHVLSWLFCKHDYLIVFDGVWEENPWKPHLPDQLHGGGVIVTRKGKQALRKRMSGKLELATLLDPEKWMAKIQDDMKYKIQGLPVAARRLAQIVPNLIQDLACKKIREEKLGVWPAVDWE